MHLVHFFFPLFWKQHPVVVVSIAMLWWGKKSSFFSWVIMQSCIFICFACVTAVYFIRWNAIFDKLLFPHKTLIFLVLLSAFCSWLVGFMANSFWDIQENSWNWKVGRGQKDAWEWKLFTFLEVSRPFRRALESTSWKSGKFVFLRTRKVSERNFQLQFLILFANLEKLNVKFLDSSSAF